MIDYGLFTGEIHEGYVGIQLARETLFARPTFTFPLVCNITKEWLDEYGKNFIAIVDYIRDEASKPLLIGIAVKPDNEIISAEDKNYFLLTNKFKAWINDKENNFVIKALDDGQIFLHNEDATEPLVLGNKFKDLMKDFLKAVGEITVISPAGNTSQPINKLVFEQLSAKVDSLLSEKVKTK